MADVLPQLPAILIENVERATLRSKHVVAEGEALADEGELWRDETTLVPH